MRSRELQQICRGWQKRLRLDEWRISAKFSRELSETDYANASWDPDTREAQIWIRSAKECRRIAASTDRKVFWIERDDQQVIESVLKHELIHIVIDGHRPVAEHINTPDMEYAINRLAEALR